MTIDYVVKKQAIDLHLQGRGRNEIARILNSQKMKISEATITHLIQDWKRRHQQQQTKCNNSESLTHTPSQPPSPLQLPQASPQSSQTLELQVCPELPSFASASDASISTAIDMNNVGSPVLTASGRPGVGQANNVNSNVTIIHANDRKYFRKKRSFLLKPSNLSLLSKFISHFLHLISLLSDSLLFLFLLNKNTTITTFTTRIFKG